MFGAEKLNPPLEGCGLAENDGLLKGLAAPNGVAAGAALLSAPPKDGAAAPKLNPAVDDGGCELKPEKAVGWLPPKAKSVLAGPLEAGAAAAAPNWNTDAVEAL